MSNEKELDKYFEAKTLIRKWCQLGFILEGEYYTIKDILNEWIAMKMASMTCKCDQLKQEDKNGYGRLF